MLHEGGGGGLRGGGFFLTANCRSGEKGRGGKVNARLPWLSLHRLHGGRGEGGGDLSWLQTADGGGGGVKAGLL